MTKITAMAMKGDEFAFTLDNGHAYYTDEDKSQNKCDNIWFPSISNWPESDDYTTAFAIRLVDGKLQASDGFEYFELPTSAGACQGVAECVSNINTISELKAFFEGHSVGLNNDGQLVASYKGCTEILTDSIA